MLIWELIKLIGVPALLALFWVWLCLGIVKTGVRRIVAAIALQLSFVTTSFGLVSGHDQVAFLEALLPPFVVLFSYGYLASFDVFLSQVLPSAAAVGGVVLLAFLAVPKLRLWCLAPALLGFLIACVFVGERVSQRAMCSTAVTAGIREFWREPFQWSSLAGEGGQGFSFYHAIADPNGRTLQWSYKTMNWFERPTSRWFKRSDPPFDCSSVTDTLF